MKLLLTSVPPKIQISSERSNWECWNLPSVKAIVSRWSFVSLQGKKRSKITIQNNTYWSRIQVAFLAKFAIFATFGDFSRPFLAFFLLSLELCEIYYSWYFCDICYSVFLGSKKNPCYFWDICGLFEALLGLFFFLSLEFGYFYYSFYFCDICYPVYLGSKKNSCCFCDFCEICGLFGTLRGLFSF